MVSLNDALNELSKLRIRTNASKVDLNLTSEEAKACIKSFTEMMGSMVVPHNFATSIDLDLLEVLPDIINSPYVNIEPGILTSYQVLAGTRREEKKAQAEIINDIDDWKSVDQDDGIQQKVDDFCTRMQEIMTDWNLESTMREGMSEELKYILADHVMTIYAIIIGVRRLVRRTRSRDFIDKTSLGAARKIAQLVLDFSVESAPPGLAQAVCNQ
ncbi:hypothetical protein N0V95_003222 [Ascochyta clinopodiicola]|nr:hypothetical protein N0V95_003222 [Ascochyta clinopodiicola]